MSERTKKIKITTINSHGDYYIGNKYRYIAIVVADVLSPKNVAKANAKELVRRFNAFEEGGLVDELRKACKGLIEDKENLEQDEAITACQCTTKMPEEVIEPLPCSYCIAKTALAKS